jgi:hypothetical protein
MTQPTGDSRLAHSVGSTSSSPFRSAWASRQRLPEILGGNGCWLGLPFSTRYVQGDNIRVMGRRASLPEGAEELEAHCKGNCTVCGIWGETKPKFPVKVDLSLRKPDGSLYTMDEMREAVADFVERFNKGPFMHGTCALMKAWIAVGFNIETGEYDFPVHTLQAVDQAN